MGIRHECAVSWGRSCWRELAGVGERRREDSKRDERLVGGRVGAERGGEDSEEQRSINGVCELDCVRAGAGCGGMEPPGNLTLMDIVDIYKYT